MGGTTGQEEKTFDKGTTIYQTKPEIKSQNFQATSFETNKISYHYPGQNSQ